MDLADLVLVFTYAELDVLSGAEAGKNVLHVGPLRTPNSRASDLVRRFPDRPLVVMPTPFSSPCGLPLGCAVSGPFRMPVEAFPEGNCPGRDTRLILLSDVLERMR